MNEQIKDGGPAFPSHGSMGEVTHAGMTLRDYFAAKAMSDLQRDGWNDAKVSECAYALADAMLAAREDKS